MNKKLVAIIIGSFLLASVYMFAQEPAAAGNFLDLYNDTNRIQQDVAYHVRENFEHQFAEIEHQRKQLGDLKDSGDIGPARYEQESKTLDAQQKSVEDDMRQAREADARSSQFVEGFFSSGWKSVLEHGKAEDKLKEAVAQAGVTQAVANEGSLERFKFAFQKDNLTKAGVLLTVTTAGAVGSYYGLKFIYKYFYATLGMPSLTHESSRDGVLSSYFSWAMPKKQPINQAEAFSHVVLAPELEKTILSVANATAMTHAKGLQYRHMLLYGPPGTGKTLIAKTIARSSGMDYIVISGAEVAQFKPGVGIQKLNELFDWAEHGERGLVLVIDEADALLRDRKDLSEKGVNLVNTFLSRTNGSSEKFMLVLASNYPETLDSAVLSRINKKIEIPAPGLSERVKLLQLYINQYLRQATLKKGESPLTLESTIDNSFINGVAQKLGGFTGRSIDQLVAEVGIEALMTPNNVVSLDLFNGVVASKVNEHQRVSAWDK